MKRIATGIALGLLLAGGSLRAQLSPAITAWYLNTTNYTGYNGLLADCQQVEYSTNYAYVSCSGIPAYTIGPWPNQPFTANAQNWVFKIALNPVENTGTKTATGGGNIGVLVNGATIFNAQDAMSYNNQNIWHQDANHFEVATFDATGGHPSPQNAFHYHRRPLPLCPNDSSAHSGIIGFAFDGFPIYGPFGYASPMNSGSGIKRIISGYRLRNISDRTTLPDGTVLQPSQYGPAISGNYTLGAYVEDYEFVTGIGDLDEYNGRFCVTPEYPGGTYAYFATTDFSHDPTYPYLIGPEYYGTLVQGNTGPGGGHVTITEPTTIWSGTVAVAGPASQGGLAVYPNPASGEVFVQADGGLAVALVNATGQVIRNGYVGDGVPYRMDLEGLPAGMYFLQAKAQGQVYSHKLFVR